jgi:hypothetical protein
LSGGLSPEEFRRMVARLYAFIFLSFLVLVVLVEFLT